MSLYTLSLTTQSQRAFSEFLPKCFRLVALFQSTWSLPVVTGPYLQACSWGSRYRGSLFHVRGNPIAGTEQVGHIIAVVQNSQVGLGISMELTTFGQPVYNRSNVFYSRKPLSWGTYLPNLQLVPLNVTNSGYLTPTTVWYVTLLHGGYGMLHRPLWCLFTHPTLTPLSDGKGHAGTALQHSPFFFVRFGLGVTFDYNIRVLCYVVHHWGCRLASLRWRSSNPGYPRTL